jgi:enoyl-[acyl-carrier protein] reductase II
MRLITLGEMAAAVSRAGGFGVIAASGLANDRLRSELRRARELTDRPVGVNIPVYRPNAFDALEIAIEMGVKILYTSAGSPSKLMPRIREAGLKVLHKVSSLEKGIKAESAGVDAVVAMGFEAGGHVGRESITTFCLIPQLADALWIPVIASGGIADGRGLAAALALGAEGVEIGTRLVATPECPVPAFFKERVCSATCEDTLLLGREAMPIRVLRNRATAQVACLNGPEADQVMAAAGDAAYVQEGGDRETAVMPCGQVVGLVRSVVSVQEVIRELVQGAERIWERQSGGEPWARRAVEEAPGIHRGGREPGTGAAG